MAERSDSRRRLLPLPFIPDERLGGAPILYGDRVEGKRITLDPAALKRLQAKAQNIKCSKVFRGVLDYLLDLAPRTKPPITGLVLSSDKRLVASIGGSMLITCFIGTEWELLRNLSELVLAMELEEPEIDALSYQWTKKITDESRPGAALILG